MESEHAEEAIRFAPFDQIDTFPSQIFWLAVTFAILYFASANWLLPKIRKAIEDRESAISTDIAEAAALSDKADASVRAFEADIAKAKASARDTASQAKAEADARIAQQTAKVEADLAKNLAEAEARISGVRTAAMANVSDVAADTAAAIVEKLTGAKADAAKVKAAVSNVMGDR